ncbi:beta-propeller domain-containing protein [Candidatus Micrarchaeota archaeon]|nr:beta-propeller domain-containing protein [Candidatus Micrarchaeota archaeon]
MKGNSFWLGFAVVVIAAFVIVGISLPGPGPMPSVTPTVNPSVVALGSDLKSFESWENVASFLASAQQPQGGYRGYGIAEDFAFGAPLAAAKSGEAAPDYSTTNVQVQGVDEADVFKTDGTYIYTLSGDDLVIARAYPASDAKVLSVLNDSNMQYSGFFINGDRLVALGSKTFDWEPYVKPLEQKIQDAVVDSVVTQIAPAAGVASKMIAPDYYPYYSQTSFIDVYDISDRSSPKLVQRVDVKGSYVASRMIGGRVYAVFSDYANVQVPRPLYAVDGEVAEILPSDIRYIDYPFDSYQFTTMLGFDVANPETLDKEIVLMGGAQTVYVSKDNAYIAYTRYPQYLPLWESYAWAVDSAPQEVKDKISAADASDVSEWRKDNLKIAVVQDYLNGLDDAARQEAFETVYEKENELRGKYTPTEVTSIHRFALGQQIQYQGEGQVPGHLLNQFSLDEFEGFLRVATTTGQVWGQSQPSKNHVYVLDSGLTVVGKLEDLAPGETIYSARFMDSRAYLVTFRQLDPLFVIGLDDPTHPELLGKLKIPGYSNYLHPYDDTHLIGLGKDAVPLKDSDLAFPLGLKLSLFDVSDVSNPVELGTFGIGDAGSDSYALSDHKAFLFDKEKNLLVIPVRVAQVPPERKTDDLVHVYGDVVFEGAYAFGVDPSCAVQNACNVFNLKGNVSHVDAEQLKKMGDYYYGGGTDVKRSAYIGDVLYTVSDSYIKANALSDLTELKSVKLPYDPGYVGPFGPYIEGDVIAVR